MQLSCPSLVCNKLFQKNRFLAFQHFQPPPLILRKNEGIMSATCSAIKQARSRGILHEFYTPPSTIMPPLKVWGRHSMGNLLLWCLSRSHTSEHHQRSSYKSDQPYPGTEWKPHYPYPPSAHGESAPLMQYLEYRNEHILEDSFFFSSHFHY